MNEPALDTQTITPAQKNKYYQQSVNCTVMYKEQNNFQFLFFCFSPELDRNCTVFHVLAMQRFLLASFLFSHAQFWKTTKDSHL